MKNRTPAHSWPSCLWEGAGATDVFWHRTTTAYMQLASAATRMRLYFRAQGHGAPACREAPAQGYVVTGCRYNPFSPLCSALRVVR